MVQAPLHVDTERLTAAARQLLAAANEMPTPSPPQARGGSDPLSQAIAAQVGKVEAPVTEGLPAVQKDAIRNAGNVATAAKRYEDADRRIADEINKRTFPKPDDNLVRAAGFGAFKDAPPPDPKSMTEAEARAAWAAVNADVQQYNARCGRTFLLPNEQAVYAACLADRGPLLERQAAIRARLNQLGIPIEESGVQPPAAPETPPFPPPTGINGFTSHAQEQVNGRDGGHGVSDSAMEDAVSRAIGPPSFKPDPYGGTYTYVGKGATVVVNKDGQVVTAWANSRSGWRNP